jgi:O-antigen/teichoic acid export membrane protein
MEQAETALAEPLHIQQTAATYLAEGAHFELPTPISSSMRWTLWLSLLALPFSYATNVLLARIGPEALGTFGVLNIYIGIVFVFFFLGGCAVPMKFLPGMAADRRSSFLASYGLVILLSFLPWLILATWRPQLLHFLFGDAGTPHLQLQLIYLSPLCLAYLLMITSLKGILEMKWAQILDRGITFGLTLVLLLLLVCNPVWLKQHAANVVWLTYIGLTFLVAVAAFCRLISVGAFTGRPRFWLPSRFWPYTLLLQANGFLSVLGSRLDYILILNIGGLARLGDYVAITSIAGVIPRIAGFVVDSLLPALTNCLSAGNVRSTTKVAEIHFRLIFPAVLGLSIALSLFVRPILAIMGQHYIQFAGLVQIACLGAAVQSFNGYNNTIFTATDRVRHGVIATAARCIAFAGSFWPLWTHLQLAGAVISWTIGELAYHAASLYLLRRNPSIKVPMGVTYLGCISSLPLMLPLARYALRAEYFVGAALGSLALLVFLAVARYTPGEVRRFANLIMNARTGPALG